MSEKFICKAMKLQVVELHRVVEFFTKVHVVQERGVFPQALEGMLLLLVMHMQVQETLGLVQCQWLKGWMI